MRKLIHIAILFVLLQTSLTFAQNSIDSFSGRSINSQDALNETASLPDLTNEEKEYLAQKKTIKICVDPSWMPFEAISNKKHVGMSADYLDLVAQKLGINFQRVPTESWTETLEKVKSRECDILPLAMATPERKTYLNFTTPYIVIPLVIATTKDKPFIADLTDVLHHRMGLVKDYAFTEFLRMEYPEMDITEFDTIYDGLAALEKNEIYGFIDNLTTISYKITHYFSSSIKISGRINRNWELGIAVRNDDPVLSRILEKAVRSIDSNAVQEIHSKWIAVTYEHLFDYSLLWKVLSAAGVVGFLFLSRYRKINRFNKTLQDLNVRLKESEESFRSLVDNAHEGIVVVQNKRLVFVNPRACEMTGYDHGALLELENFLPLIAPEARETMMANHLKRLAGKASPVRYESQFLKRDGTIYPIELTGVLISWKNNPATLNILSDISERKASEDAVRFMALHDNLTRLPNRYLLMERLEQSLAQARRSRQPMVVLFMDLDGFKQVNDIYGHDVGDKLLQGVAERVQQLMRDSDTLARMGGDEFVILLPQVDGLSGVETLISRINEALQSPFQFDSIEVKGRASVGFSLFPENGETAEELLRVADQNMYVVKQKGRSRPAETVA
nr:diguanylate cyclase [uncultured Desulfuromonas sp.]